MKQLKTSLAWLLRVLVRLAQGPGGGTTPGMRLVQQRHARMRAQGLTWEAEAKVKHRASGALIREIRHRVSRQVQSPNDEDLAEAAALIVVELDRRRRARLV